MADESGTNELNTSNKGTLINSNNLNKGVINKNKDLNKISVRQTIMMEEKVEETGSLDDKGKIEEAKKHRSANRPLHKKRDFNNNVNFCHCCNLPCEEKGIIEPFHFCDNIDKFAECGLGVSLYFYFFRFAICVIFVGICVMAISIMIFNHHYTKGINRVCNNNYVRVGINDLPFCDGFITVANESLNVYTRFNDWILRFTSDNMYIYQLLHNNLTNTHNTKKVLINYSILNFLFLFTIFIFNIFYIIFITAHSQKAKLLNFSIRDYTVLISNATHILIEYIEEKRRKNPKFEGSIKDSQLLVENTSEFIAFVNEYIRSDKSLIDLKINNINMCYNLGSYIELRDEYEKCKKKIFKIKNDPDIIEINSKKGNLFDNRYYYKFPLFVKCIKIKDKPLITLEKQKSDLEKQIEFELQNIQVITEKNFTGYMFVSFSKIKDKETILSQYPNNFFGMMLNFIKNIKYYLCCCCVGKGEKIKFSKIRGIDVEDPPEPEDLYWENFKYNSSQRGVRIALVFLVCLLIIAISFIFVLLFTVGQNKLTEDNRKMNLFVKYFLSFLISIIISILNAVLEGVLTKLTFLEKHLSRTNFYLSLSIKITILTFFNSAIVPLLAKEIAVDKKVRYDYNIDRNNLIVTDMFILFVVNAIVTPLLWTFNIPFLIKKFRIYLIEKQKEPDESHHMTQRELNKLYELPDMKIAYKYSYLAKTLAMALFYFPIFPMGYLISFVGFILGYLLELFNFTHLYKRPEMLDEIITKVYADYFIIILFIGGISDYFFFHDIFPSPDNRWSLVNIIIFGILIIVPYTKFINCNFVGIEKSEFHNYSLSEVYFTFYNDYQRQNPLTKRVGLLNYLTQLNKNGYLSNNAFDVAQKNIENLNIMEIYYGISRGNIPIVHQSIMANTNNSSISVRNVRQSIIAPNFRDNDREKIKKQKFFDSQIMNMFASKISKKDHEHPINYPMDTILEEEEENKFATKDKLVNAYNNPLGINMGLGPLPMDDNIYKSIPMSKSIKKSTKDENKFKNSLSILKSEEELKKNYNIPFNSSENFNKDNLESPKPRNTIQSKEKNNSTHKNINNNSIDNYVNKNSLSNYHDQNKNSLSSYHDQNKNSLSNYKEQNKNSLSNYGRQNKNSLFNYEEQNRNFPQDNYEEQNNDSSDISENLKNAGNITQSEESRKNMPFNANINENREAPMNESGNMNDNNLKTLFNTSSNDNQTEKDLVTDTNDYNNYPMDSYPDDVKNDNNNIECGNNGYNNMNDMRFLQDENNDLNQNLNNYNQNDMPRIPNMDNNNIDINNIDGNYNNNSSGESNE